MRHFSQKKGSFLQKHKNPRGYYSEPEIRYIFGIPSFVSRLEFLLSAIEQQEPTAVWRCGTRHRKRYESKLKVYCATIKPFLFFFP